MTEATASGGTETPSSGPSEDFPSLASSCNPWKTVRSPRVSDSVPSSVTNGLHEALTPVDFEADLAAASQNSCRPKKLPKTKKANWKPLAVAIVTKDPKEGERDIRGGGRGDTRRPFVGGRKPVNRSSSGFSQTNSRQPPQSAQNNHHNNASVNHHSQQKFSEINASESPVSRKADQEGEQNTKQSRAASSVKPGKFPEEPFPSSQQRGQQNSSNKNNNVSIANKNGSGGNKQPETKGNSSRGNTSSPTNGSRPNSNNNFTRPPNNYRNNQWRHHQGNNSRNNSLNNNNGTTNNCEGGDFSTPASSSGRATPNGFSPLLPATTGVMDEFTAVSPVDQIQYFVDYSQIGVDSPSSSSGIMSPVLAAVPAGVTVLPTPSFAGSTPVPSVTATTS